MPASMSEVDPRADTPPLNWSDMGEQLPTGTVTLLLADVEGSTRLWQAEPEEMTAAIARLDRTVCDIIGAHDGVRPVEQGEGDSFVAAFTRASDAVACALQLQRAPLAPIRLRIGVHTGEVQLRDDGNYIGQTINRTARLRDLAHGGQTVLSGTTEDLVLDSLPADTWLTHLGSHELRGVFRPERVVQLCHPDLRNEFPPLRTSKPIATHRLPVQLTSFVGRGAEIKDLRQILCDNRLVTLTGAGGAGKTRLAIQTAAEITTEFGDGVWYVDLAPITDPDLVPVAVARALALPDQPGRATVDTLIRFAGDRQMLIVLDNCEHLIDACAALVVALLGDCPRLTLLATSREPIGVTGEATWRVPSLSLADEAVELFADRARLAQADFTITDGNAALVIEICRRLDGMPLAIELAAARVRVLSLTEIRDGLHDRFRLLTGGARTAARRQQTLRASVDWSHALLTEPERILFARLAVFMGGFDLNAAQAIAGGDVESYQILDLLTLLVDKSLVVAESTSSRTRYRLLEAMRQYALEKLGESGEADAVRTLHRDHFTEMAALLATLPGSDRDVRLEWSETEIDNLRAAFAWSRENSDIALASQLASALQPLWLTRGRTREGLTWFNAALTDQNAHPAEVAPAVRARALADAALLDGFAGAANRTDQAEEALAIARELGDPTLLVRALTACGGIHSDNPQVARPYFAEALGLARAAGDNWRLSQILGWQARAAFHAGDPITARTAGEEGRDLADAVGDRFVSRQCRCYLAGAQAIQGDLVGAAAQLHDLIAEAHADADANWTITSLHILAQVLAYQGDTSAARTAANAAIEGAAEVSMPVAIATEWNASPTEVRAREVAAELGEVFEGGGYLALAVAALAEGDIAAAEHASGAGWRQVFAQPAVAALYIDRIALVALAAGDLIAARRWADDAVAATTGWHQSAAMTTRARVAIARDEPEQAERDAHEALAIAASTGAYVGTPDALECLAALAIGAGSHREAARLFGAADGIRHRIGQVRFQVHQADYAASVETLRDAIGDEELESAWAKGAALSTEEAIAYAQRGRGERKRPTSGWGSLTPTEREVVRLVSKGLTNKNVATRLFISPRTVDTHLTHVYTKLGLTSRVQLAREAPHNI
jgi:predicted ATPase/class 3 adenylate cyclase/DNA-binding CsgD family transcriptional regulator